MEKAYLLLLTLCMTLLFVVAGIKQDRFSLVISQPGLIILEPQVEQQEIKSLKMHGIISP